MSNELTGDFEAAVEISIEALNRILATLHQAGASEEASPKLLHEIIARVGDSPAQPKFEMAEAFLQNLASTSGQVFSYSQDVLRKLQNDLSTIQKTLVGVLRGLSDAGGPSEHHFGSYGPLPDKGTIHSRCRHGATSRAYSWRSQDWLRGSLPGNW